MTPAATRTALTRKLAGGAPAFRQRLERMGPTYVKIGQFLALRPDLVPDDYSRELMSLLDRVEPFPWGVAATIVEEDLGRPASELFTHVNPHPVATGSMAQAHVVRLRDGSEAVVKVQRPGVDAQIRRDLTRADRLARILDALGLSLVVAPRDLVEEVGWWLDQELDFRNELRNMQRLYELAEDSPFERIPVAYPELSGERVLTAEYLRGIPLSEVLAALREGSDEQRERVRRLRIDRETLATNIISAVLRQMFEYGFFHADAHPGNLLVLPDGRVGFVDFGLCDELDDTVRRTQLEGLHAAYSGDVEAMFDVLLKILEPGEETDLAAFRRDFSAHTKTWLARIQVTSAGRRGPASRDEEEDGRPRLLGAPEPEEDSGGAFGDEAAGSPIGQWMLGTVGTAREHGMQLPPRVLSMYRTLLTAETVVQQLGSRASLRTVGRNFFVRLKIHEELRSVAPTEWQRSASSLLALYRDGPRHLHRALGDLADGRLNINVTVSESPATAGARRRRMRLVTVAILSVALAASLAAPPVTTTPGLQVAVWVALVLAWLSTAVGLRRMR